MSSNQKKPNLAKKIGKAAKKLAVKESKTLLRNVIAPHVGDYVTAATGSRAVGKLTTGGLRAIAGKGDYVVHGNTLATHGQTIHADFLPEFVKHGARGITVRHREYIGDVISSATPGAFKNTSYTLNPGIVDSFPWLSTIAQNFDQWHPNGIVYSFKSTSSSYSGGASQALGVVIIASDYDVTDAAYATKVEMENSEFCVSCKSDSSILHPIECAENERQVRTLKVRGISTPSDNLQWYDLCNVQVATQGCPVASTNVGELWVSYDITFYKEQIYGGLGGLGVYEAKFEGSTGISTSAYLGSNGTANSTNTVGVTFNGVGTFTFPTAVSTGSWLMIYTVLGASTAVVAPTITLTNAAVSAKLWDVNTAIGTGGLTTTRLVVAQCFDVSALSAAQVTVALSGGTLPTSATAAQIAFVLINPTIA